MIGTSPRHHSIYSHTHMPFATARKIGALSRPMAPLGGHSIGDASGQKSLITVFGGRIFWEIWGQSLEATQEQPRASIFWDIKCGSRNRTCVSHTGAISASTFDIRDNRNFSSATKEKRPQPEPR